MRNKINSLLGRNLKASKLKPLVSLAISRVAVLKNQRHVRCSQARSDVLQLLQLGNHERALLRVEHVIKEQNMLDVYDMLEYYCNLLIERFHLIENQRVCPEELREAISGMLYGASRCGDFPELHEIRAILTSHFGKEFAARAIELRNNCGVNHAIIQKLSTRQPSLENRMMVVKEIASESSIVLQLEEVASITTQEKSGSSDIMKAEEIENDYDRFSDSVKTRKKYKDVADAAQAAFESAAYAAAAARAAVELSRSGHDSDTQNSPGSLGGNSPQRYKPMKIESESEEEKNPIQNQSSRLKRSASSSSSDSVGQPSEKDVAIGGKDSEILNGEYGPDPCSGFQADQREEYVDQHSIEHDVADMGIENKVRLNFEKVPLSVRTRRLRRF